MKAAAGNNWIRCHMKTRRSKFTPFKVAKGPKTSGEVGNIRINMFLDRSSNRYNVDAEEWGQLKNQHQVIPPAVGYTIFTSESEMPELLGRLEIKRN